MTPPEKQTAVRCGAAAVERLDPSPTTWAISLVRWVVRSGTAFGRYTRLSFVIAAAGGPTQGPAGGARIFPSPLPAAAVLRQRRTWSPTRCARDRFDTYDRARSGLLNLVVVALNFMAWNMSPKLPVRDLRRQPSLIQREMYQRLLLFVDLWLSDARNGDADPLGRSTAAVSEFLVAQGEIAAHWVSALPSSSAALSPYTALGATGPIAPTGTTELNVDRLSYDSSIISFDITPFLDAQVRLAFLEPASIRRRVVDSSRFDWRVVHPRTKAQHAALGRQWAPAGKLFLAGGGAADYQTAVAFNGTKLGDKDRQLLDQRGPNAWNRTSWAVLRNPFQAGRSMST